MRKLGFFALFSMLTTVCFGAASIRASSVPLTSLGTKTAPKTSVSTLSNNNTSDSDSGANVSLNPTNSVPANSGRIAFSSPFMKQNSKFTMLSNASHDVVTANTAKELIELQQQIDDLLDKQSILQNSLETQNTTFQDVVSDLQDKAAELENITDNKINTKLVETGIVDNNGNLIVATKSEIEPVTIAEKIVESPAARETLSGKVGTDEAAVKELIASDLKDRNIIDDSEKLKVATTAVVDELSAKAITTDNLDATLTAKKVAKTDDVTADAIATKIAASETAQQKLAGKIGPDETAVKDLIKSDLKDRNIIDNSGNLQIATSAAVSELQEKAITTDNVDATLAAKNVATTADITADKIADKIAASTTAQQKLAGKIGPDETAVKGLVTEGLKEHSILDNNGNLQIATSAAVSELQEKAITTDNVDATLAAKNVATTADITADKLATKLDSKFAKPTDITALQSRATSLETTAAKAITTDNLGDKLDELKVATKDDLPVIDDKTIASALGNSTVVSDAVDSALEKDTTIARKDDLNNLATKDDIKADTLATKLDSKFAKPTDITALQSRAASLETTAAKAITTDNLGDKLDELKVATKDDLPVLDDKTIASALGNSTIVSDAVDSALEKDTTIARKDDLNNLATKDDIKADTLATKLDSKFAKPTDITALQSRATSLETTAAKAITTDNLDDKLVELKVATKDDLDATQESVTELNKMVSGDVNTAGSLLNKILTDETVRSALKGKDGTSYKLKGSVPTYDKLPSDAIEGDGWVVEADGLLYVYTCDNEDKTNCSYPEKGLTFKGEKGEKGDSAKSVEQTYCEENIDIVQALYTDITNADECAKNFTNERYTAIIGGTKAYCLSLAKEKTIDLSTGLGKKLLDTLGSKMNDFVKTTTIKDRLLMTGFTGNNTDKATFMDACEDKYDEIISGKDAETAWHAYCTKDDNLTNIIQPLYSSVKSCDDFTSDQYNAIMGGAKAYCLSLAKDAANLDLKTGIGKKLAKTFGESNMQTFQKTISLKDRLSLKTFTGKEANQDFVSACEDKYNEIMAGSAAKSIEQTYCEAQAENYPSGTTNLSLIKQLYPTVKSCEDFTPEMYNAITGGAKAYCLSLAKKPTNLNAKTGLGLKLEQALGTGVIDNLKTNKVSTRVTINGTEKNFVDACEEKYNEIMSGSDGKGYTLKGSVEHYTDLPGTDNVEGDGWYVKDNGNLYVYRCDKDGTCSYPAEKDGMPMKGDPGENAETTWHAYCMEKDKDGVSNLTKIISHLYPEVTDCDKFTSEQFNAIQGGAKAYCLSLATNAATLTADSGIGLKLEKTLGAGIVNTLKQNKVATSLSIDGKSKNFVTACEERYNEIMAAETAWYAYCTAKNEKDTSKTNLEVIIQPLYSTVKSCDDFTSEQYNAIQGGAKAYCLSLAKDASSLDLTTGIGERLAKTFGESNMDTFKKTTSLKDRMTLKTFTGKEANQDFVTACEAKYNEIMSGEDAKSVEQTYCEENITIVQALYTDIKSAEDCADKFTNERYTAIQGGAKAYCLSLAKETNIDLTTGIGKRLADKLGSKMTDFAKATSTTSRLTMTGFKSKDTDNANFMDACEAKYDEIMAGEDAKSVEQTYCEENITIVQALYTDIKSAEDCADKFTNERYTAIQGGAKAYCLSLAKEKTIDLSAGIGKRLVDKLGSKMTDFANATDAASRLSMTGFKGKDTDNAKFMDACEAKYDEIMSGEDAKSVEQTYCEENIEIVKALYSSKIKSDADCADKFTNDDYTAIMGGAKAYCLSLTKDLVAGKVEFTDGIGKKLAKTLDGGNTSKLSSFSGKSLTTVLNNSTNTYKFGDKNFMDACEAKYNEIMAGDDAETAWHAYCMENNNLTNIITPLYSTVKSCDDFTSDQYNAIQGGAKAYCLSLAKETNIDLTTGIGKRLADKLGSKMTDFAKATSTASRLTMTGFKGKDTDNANFMDACEAKYNEIMSGEDAETAWYAYCTAKNEKDTSKTNLEVIIQPLYSTVKSCDDFTSEQYNAIQGGAKAYCLSLAKDAGTLDLDSGIGKKLSQTFGADNMETFKNKTSLKDRMTLKTFTGKEANQDFVTACEAKYNEIMSGEDAKSVEQTYCEENITIVQALYTDIKSAEDCADKFTNERYTAIQGGAKAYCLSLAKETNIDLTTGIGKRLADKLGSKMTDFAKATSTTSRLTMTGFKGKGTDNANFMDACEAKYDEIMAGKDGEDAKPVEQTYCEENITIVQALYTDIKSAEDCADKFTNERYTAIQGGAKAYCLSLAKETNIDLTTGIGKRLADKLGSKMTDFAKATSTASRLTMTGFKSKDTDNANFMDACEAKYDEIMSGKDGEDAETAWHAYCVAQNEKDTSKTNLEVIIQPLYSTVKSCDDFTSEQYNAIQGGAKAYCLSLAKDAGTLDLDSGIGKKLSQTFGADNMETFKNKTSLKDRMTLKTFTGKEANQDFVTACEAKYNEIMSGDDGKDAKSVEQTYCEENIEIVKALYSSKIKSDADCADNFTNDDYTAIMGGAKAYCLSLAKEKTIDLSAGIGKRLVDKLGSKMTDFANATDAASRLSMTGFKSKDTDNAKFMDACEAKYDEIMAGKDGEAGDDAATIWCKAHTTDATAGLTATAEMSSAKMVRAFDKLGGTTTAASKINTTSGTFKSLADCLAAVAADPSLMGGESAADEKFNEEKKGKTITLDTSAKTELEEAKQEFKNVITLTNADEKLGNTFAKSNEVVKNADFASKLRSGLTTKDAKEALENSGFVKSTELSTKMEQAGFAKTTDIVSRDDFATQLQNSLAQENVKEALKTSVSNKVESSVVTMDDLRDLLSGALVVDTDGKIKMDESSSKTAALTTKMTSAGITGVNSLKTSEKLSDRVNNISNTAIQAATANSTEGITEDKCNTMDSMFWNNNSKEDNKCEQCPDRSYFKNGKSSIPTERCVCKEESEELVYQDEKWQCVPAQTQTNCEKQDNTYWANGTCNTCGEGTYFDPGSSTRCMCKDKTMKFDSNTGKCVQMGQSDCAANGLIWDGKTCQPCDAGGASAAFDSTTNTCVCKDTNLTFSTTKMACIKCGPDQVEQNGECITPKTESECTSHDGYAWLSESQLCFSCATKKLGYDSTARTCTCDKDGLVFDTYNGYCTECPAESKNGIKVNYDSGTNSCKCANGGTFDWAKGECISICDEGFAYVEGVKTNKGCVQCNLDLYSLDGNIAEYSPETQQCICPEGAFFSTNPSNLGCQLCDNLKDENITYDEILHTCACKDGSNFDASTGTCTK